MESNLPVDTDLPVVSNLPVVTDLSVARNMPVASDLPVASNLPVATDLPVASDLPVATELPVASHSDSSCYLQAKLCYNSNLHNLQTSLTAFDFRGACNAWSQLSLCTGALRSNSTCLPALIDNIVTKFKGDALLDGCDSQCGDLLTRCSSTSLLNVTLNPINIINWTDVCVQAHESRRCMINIRDLRSGDCEGKTQLVSHILNSQLNYFSKYCTTNGQPSSCLTSLEQCKVHFMTSLETNNSRYCE
ncbi:uncharacterized protein LOC131928844 [Physella acuta]|uniref:uncharacterized protein LOC131928844 n=1 Tax=Physella acuta TaxID=109671 RepID=UPI0027DB156E|nr:uncharacterized protein LOC131928844 [Physella acuta]